MNQPRRLTLADLDRADRTAPAEESSPSRTSPLEDLARSNPTGYRLLWVLNDWAAYIQRNSGGTSRLALVLGKVVPHMADDIANVPEDKLRAGLEQIRETIGAILNGQPPQPAPGPAELP